MISIVEHTLKFEFALRWNEGFEFFSGVRFIDTYFREKCNSGEEEMLKH